MPKKRGLGIRCQFQGILYSLSSKYINRTPLSVRIDNEPMYHPYLTNLQVSLI